MNVYAGILALIVVLSGVRALGGHHSGLTQAGGYNGSIHSFGTENLIPYSWERGLPATAIR